MYNKLKLNEFNDELTQKVIMEASSIIYHNEPKLYFIQGPPGTGKSTTIIGILNAIFARSKAMSNKQTIKILICSPSNTGCDELVRKISSSRTSSQSYLNTVDDKDLKIVRLGRSERIHEDSNEFNFDDLAREKYDELVDKYSKTNSNCPTYSTEDHTYISLLEKENEINERIEDAKSSKRTIKNLENQRKAILKRL